MIQPSFLTAESDGVLEFTLNRPEKLNALNAEIFHGLREAVDALATRDELRVLLIRATGRYFCAGVDLTGAEPDMHGSSKAVRAWYRRELHGMMALYQEMEAVEKPIVVAHHATCVGGGLELSLSCDFRLAAASASYAFPEATLGMIPASGGVSRLSRLTGPHWARWMILANKPVSAERALVMGLVHDIYPDAEFEENVRDFCRHLAAQPPEMTGIAKVAIELATDLESAQARNVERLANSILSLGKEHEGLLATMKARLMGKK
jgi:enoyl-CoA hydratase